jgi:uncharacterized protein (DUF1800 family)
MSTAERAAMPVDGTFAGAATAGNISDAEASRFLAQASMGASRTEMASVQQLGYSAWLAAQFALPQSQSRWDALLAQGFDTTQNQGSELGFDVASWRKLIASPDTLRQRMAFSLSEILVVGISGLNGGWKAFSAAHYQDILENNAFGNFRQLLDEVTLSPAMAEWLTYRGSVKANVTSGSLPDENYAREIMQLFTLGLVELNLDGTPLLVNGVAQATYTQDDVMGLARVWTGWNWDTAGLTGAAALATPAFQGRPLHQVPANSETGEKHFLDTIIPAGTDGVNSKRIALDALFKHSNVGPFIGKQLIQRLVTSNPSPAYVARVASAFNSDETGVRGNLQAVLKAILLDDEARNAANIALPTFGKLREPILRFTQWAKAFAASSPSNAWLIGNTSDPTTRLGQSPLRSPTVFNFFRPGYTPPNTATGKAGLLAPEFQITNANSVVGYVNFMQRVISSGVGDVVGNYSTLLALARDATALVGEINTVLAAGQVSAANVNTMVSALTSMPSSTAANLNNRVYAALLLVLAAPDYIVQK